MKRIIFAIVIIFSLNIFSNPSATILEQVVKYKINSDKTVVKHVYEKVKLNNPAAFNHFGEWFYTYNPKLEKINIIKSRTIKEDKTFVDTPENGILIQSPYETEDAPDFSYFREYMVSHIGLEPNCVVEFEYEIIDLKPHKTYLFERMGGDFPVVKKTVIIEGEYIRDFRSDVVKKDGNKYFVENQPYYNGSYYVKDFEQVPYVAFLIGDTTRKINEAFKLNESDNLKNALNILKIKNNSSKFQIVETLKDFANNKLVKIELPAEKTGYERRSLEKIISSGFATDLEKAVLVNLVLTNFNIPNDVFINCNKNKGDFLIHPNFQVNSMEFGLIYPKNISYYGLIHKSLDGKVVKVNKNKVLNISINLEETLSNGLQGNIYVEGENLDSQLNSYGCNFVKNGKIKDENIRQLIANKQVLAGKYALAIENGKIQLNWNPENLINLKHVFDSLTSTTSTEILENIQFKLNLNIVFNNKIEADFKNSKLVSNSAGFSEINWVINNNNLSYTKSLKLNKGTYSLNEYKKLRQLVAPMFNVLGEIVFLRKK